MGIFRGLAEGRFAGNVAKRIGIKIGVSADSFPPEVKQTLLEAGTMLYQQGCSSVDEAAEYLIESEAMGDIFKRIANGSY